jgi:hypothetical protein
MPPRLDIPSNPPELKALTRIRKISAKRRGENRDRVTPHRSNRRDALCCRQQVNVQQQSKSNITMAKKSRGGRMTAAKNRAKKSSGGKGLIKNRPAGRNIMKT